MPYFRCSRALFKFLATIADTRFVKLSRLGPLLAALLAVVTLAGTVGYNFVYDDHVVVRQNSAARDPSDWRAIVLTPSWGGGGYRPLTTWTFAVNHAMHGPWAGGYHLVNVALHALVAALVVVTASALGATPLAAALAGALFATHPVHVEAVASIVGRAELLCAVWMLLAVLAHLRGGRLGWPPGHVAGVLALVAAGLLSKEYAATLVVALPLLDLLVTDGGSLTCFRERFWGRRAVVYGAIGLVTLAWATLREAVAGASMGYVEPWMNPLAHAPVSVRIWTALRIQAHALGLLVVPIGLRPDYSEGTIPLVHDPSSAAGLLGIAVLLAIILLAIRLARRDSRALFWLLLGGLSWGLVSNVVVPIGVVFAERLLYLPSASFCVLAALFLDQVGTRLRSRLAAPLAVSLLVLAWIPWAWQTHGMWRNDMTLARAMVARSPGSAHAHDVLGTVYVRRGRLPDALKAFDRALALDPDYSGSLYNAALAHRARGEYAAARPLLRRLVRRYPRYVSPWIALAATELDLSHPTRALKLAEQALRLAPDVAALHVERALALSAMHRSAEAAKAFRHALRLAPDLAVARRGLERLGG